MPPVQALTGSALLSLWAPPYHGPWRRGVCFAPASVWDALWVRVKARGVPRRGCSMVDVLDKITGGSTEFGVPAHQQRVELQVMDQASKTLLNLEAGRLEGIYWLLVRFGVC
jgi:hypothetical protein